MGGVKTKTGEVKIKARGINTKWEKSRLRWVTLGQWTCTLARTNTFPNEHMSKHTLARINTYPNGHLSEKYLLDWTITRTDTYPNGHYCTNEYLKGN